jgi:hypothetical protein
MNMNCAHLIYDKQSKNTTAVYHHSYKTRPYENIRLMPLCIADVSDLGAEGRKTCLGTLAYNEIREDGSINHHNRGCMKSDCRRTMRRVLRHRDRAILKKELSAVVNDWYGYDLDFNSGLVDTTPDWYGRDALDSIEDYYFSDYIEDEIDEADKLYEEDRRREELEKQEEQEELEQFEQSCYCEEDQYLW